MGKMQLLIDNVQIVMYTLTCQEVKREAARKHGHFGNSLGNLLGIHVFS